MNGDNVHGNRVGSLSGAKLGIHLYSIPFVPRLFFPYPFKSKNEASHSRRQQSALPPLFDPPISPPPTPRISDFLASSRGLVRAFDVLLPSHRGHNLVRSFDVLLPSHRGPKLEFPLPFRYANFHRFLKQAIHISSKMEFLEHGKEKAIVSFKNQ
ncbi:hypothetical protein AVEN_137267-1 [Araneus ventricosus]|uniref:Uncharacterized protein n=1 Tax=Araneus ventricosus TaxID=182803 RepID=A0A4Y2DPX6_ARAVE|nr:hypothetical protein AVEN_137267-1 [Araneus ventricosus]